MKPDEQDSILDELLTGEEVADFRLASLERGLASFRQQQRRRQVFRLTVLTSIPLLLLGLLTWRSAQPQFQSRAHSNATANVTAVQRTTGIEFINDEQLFALFPERSLALVGKPGRQQLLFLDRSAITGAN